MAEVNPFAEPAVVTLPAQIDVHDAGPALVVMKLTGLDQLLPVYPALGQALATEPEPDGQAPPGDPGPG